MFFITNKLLRHEAVIWWIYEYFYADVFGGLVVSKLDCQPRGWWFKSLPGQKRASGDFLLHHYQTWVLKWVCYRTLSVGRSEDWPPILICWGQENQVAHVCLVHVDSHARNAFGICLKRLYINVFVTLHGAIFLYVCVGLVLIDSVQHVFYVS